MQLLRLYPKSQGSHWSHLLGGVNGSVKAVGFAINSTGRFEAIIFLWTEVQIYYAKNKGSDHRNCKSHIFTMRRDLIYPKDLSMGGLQLQMKALIHLPKQRQ